MSHAVAALVAILCGGCFAAWVVGLYDQIKADEERTRRELEAFYRNTQEDE